MLSVGGDLAPETSAYHFTYKRTASGYSFIRGVGLCPHKTEPSGCAKQAPAEKEVVSMPKRHLEASTPEARAKIRKNLGRLKSLTVQPVTRRRYEEARESFYSWLRQEKSCCLIQLIS